MKYLTFALAKGRLAKKSLALFEQIGISMDEMKDPDTRKLIFVNEDLKIKMFLAKASDVPTYVEYGAADIGVIDSPVLGKIPRTTFSGRRSFNPRRFVVMNRSSILKGI